MGGREEFIQSFKPLMNAVFFEGDINHDGTVNILDVSKHHWHSTQSMERVIGTQRQIDKSGGITILDISEISKK